MSEINEITIDHTEEFNNLFKLLDDEDENIYGSIKERFLFHGKSSSAFLKNFLENENFLIRKRANEIISILNFEDLEKKFINLFSGNQNDFLEEAIFLLASLGYPGINMNSYKKDLDKMAADIESALLKINPGSKKLETLEILNTINNYLFFEKGFKGNSGNYYEPDNSYINKVLDTKLGIPVSLSVIYLLITKRLKLPVFGISLPGHFIVKYSSEEEEFFIDPFNKGIIISLKEAKKFIKNTGMSEDQFKDIPFLNNSTDKEIILRMMRNLNEIYNTDGDKFRAEQIQKIMEYFD